MALFPLMSHVTKVTSLKNTPTHEKVQEMFMRQDVCLLIKKSFSKGFFLPEYHPKKNSGVMVNI